MKYFDFMKSKSSWHFDTQKKDTVDFKYVGRVIGNFQHDISEVAKKGKSWKWQDLEICDTSLDIGPLERPLNVKKVSESLTDHLINHDRLVASNSHLLSDLCKKLGLEEFNIRLIRQKPGQLTNIHIDSYYSKKNEKLIILDPKNAEVRRFICVLTDWSLGQIGFFGNSTWSHWKKGDLVTWDSQNVPHGFANAGWDDRVFAILTGFETEKSGKILEACENKLLEVFVN